MSTKRKAAPKPKPEPEPKPNTVGDWIEQYWNIPRDDLDPTMNEWVDLDTSCWVGMECVKLWMMALPLQDVCLDVRRQLVETLVHQCNVWLYG